MVLIPGAGHKVGGREQGRMRRTQNLSRERFADAILLFQRRNSNKNVLVLKHTGSVHTIGLLFHCSQKKAEKEVVVKQERSLFICSHTGNTQLVSQRLSPKC